MNRGRTTLLVTVGVVFSLTAFRGFFENNPVVAFVSSRLMGFYENFEMTLPYSFTKVVFGAIPEKYGKDPNIQAVFRDLPKALSTVKRAYSSGKAGSTKYKYGIGHIFSSVLKPTCKITVISSVIYFAQDPLTTAGGIVDIAKVGFYTIASVDDYPDSPPISESSRASEPHSSSTSFPSKNKEELYSWGGTLATLICEPLAGVFKTIEKDRQDNNDTTEMPSFNHTWGGFKDFVKYEYADLKKFGNYTLHGFKNPKIAATWGARALTTIPVKVLTTNVLYYKFWKKLAIDKELRVLWEVPVISVQQVVVGSITGKMVLLSSHNGIYNKFTAICLGEEKSSLIVGAVVFPVLFISQFLGQFFEDYITSSILVSVVKASQDMADSSAQSGMNHSLSYFFPEVVVNKTAQVQLECPAVNLKEIDTIVPQEQGYTLFKQTELMRDYNQCMLEQGYTFSEQADLVGKDNQAVQDEP